MTGNTEDAADLAQQTFCKAFDKWHQFDGKALPVTWLHRILVNNIRDWQRRSQIRQTVPLEHSVLPVREDRPAGTLDRMERKERLAHLSQSIDSLSDNLRPVFLLTVMDGYDYQAAAEVFGVPVGTIASRVHQARKKISIAMKERFPEE